MMRFTVLAPDGNKELYEGEEALARAYALGSVSGSWLLYDAVEARWHPVGKYAPLVGIVPASQPDDEQSSGEELQARPVESPVAGTGGQGRTRGPARPSLAGRVWWLGAAALVGYLIYAAIDADRAATDPLTAAASGVTPQVSGATGLQAPVSSPAAAPTEPRPAVATTPRDAGDQCPSIVEWILSLDSLATGPVRESGRGPGLGPWYAEGKAQIVQCETVITELDQSLHQLTAEVDSLKSLGRRSPAGVGDGDTNVPPGRDVYLGRIKQRVRRYNELFARRRDLFRRYDAMVDEFNRRVDASNRATR